MSELCQTEREKINFDKPEIRIICQNLDKCLPGDEMEICEGLSYNYKFGIFLPSKRGQVQISRGISAPARAWMAGVTF